MSDETPGTQSFADLVAQSGPFNPDEAPAKPAVELIGRTFSSDRDDRFVMALMPGPDGVEQVIEANIGDVMSFETVFEDSSGRKTLKVRLPQDAPVQLQLIASQLSGGGAPSLPKQDVKPDPIKQQDPQPKSDPIKQADPQPKHDPIKQGDPQPKHDPIKQGDPQPKHDPIKQDPQPKHDPIKQFDPVKGDPTPKHDPVKQHDPIKADPKGDPIGPNPGINPGINPVATGGPGTAQASQPMQPFSMATWTTQG